MPEKRMVTVDDDCVEGIESASLMAGEDMNCEDATKYFGTSCRLIEQGRRQDATLQVCMRLKEAVKSFADAEFGEVCRCWVGAGSRDYCKRGGLKGRLLEHSFYEE